MFNRIDYRSLNDLVYSQIKEKIIENKLKPGDKLDIELLSELLDVSRTPVVNALKMLERNGYVVIRPRKGSFVRSFSKEEVSAIFDFREVTEKLMIEKAIEKIDVKRIKRFEMAFFNMSKTFDGEEDEIAEFFDMEIQLHEYLIELSPKIIQNELKNLIDLTKRIRRLHLFYCLQGNDRQTLGRAEIVLHLDLCRSILKKNLEEAQRLIQKDISGTKRLILERYEEIEMFSGD